MKYFKVLVVLYIIACSSCMPTVSEVWLNKDGSGKVQTQFDLGEMAGMVSGMMNELDEDNTEPKKELFKKGESMDSTMVFYEIIPDSIKNEMSNPDILKNMIMSMSMDGDKEEAIMMMSVEYKNEDEYIEIGKAFDEMQKIKEANQGVGAEDSQESVKDMFLKSGLELKDGIIRLEGMDLSEVQNDPEYEEMMETLQSSDQSEEDQFVMEMMEMMFGGSTKTIIHAPGKILFSNDMNAKISGNTIEFEDNMMEMLKKGKSLDRLIKFEK